MNEEDTKNKIWLKIKDKKLGELFEKEQFESLINIITKASLSNYYFNRMYKEEDIKNFDTYVNAGIKTIHNKGNDKQIKEIVRHLYNICDSNIDWVATCGLYEDYAEKE